MSGATTRMDPVFAARVAERFADVVDAACEQLVIAGSLRRLQPTIGDIEIVCVPKWGERSTGLFDEFTERVNLLDGQCEHMLITGAIQKRPRADGVTFWGPKAKYMLFEGVPVDLFSPEAERFGMILAIRTGPAAFSNALVTPRGMKTRAGRDGLMPPYLKQQDGWLTYRASGERIPTPTEESVFELLKLRYIEPADRR
jgi:DNA polymerase/3'-5' exonuclease PolX